MGAAGSADATVASSVATQTAAIRTAWHDRLFSIGISGRIKRSVA
jgi:hypothetical protein